MGAVHSICTRVGSKRWVLRMRDWIVTLLNGLKQELVWKAEKYYLDIVGVFFTKYQGSDTVELNEH